MSWSNATVKPGKKVKIIAEETLLHINAKNFKDSKPVLTWKRCVKTRLLTAARAAPANNETLLSHQGIHCVVHFSLGKNSKPASTPTSHPTVTYKVSSSKNPTRPSKNSTVNKALLVTKSAIQSVSNKHDKKVLIIKLSQILHDISKFDGTKQLKKSHKKQKVARENPLKHSETTRKKRKL